MTTTDRIIEDAAGTNRFWHREAGHDAQIDFSATDGMENSKPWKALAKQFEEDPAIILKTHESIRFEALQMGQLDDMLDDLTYSVMKPHMREKTRYFKTKNHRELGDHSVGDMLIIEFAVYTDCEKDMIAFVAFIYTSRGQAVMWRKRILRAI